MRKKLLLIYIFVLLLLSSCKGIAFENKKTARAEEFPIGESMIFVAEEKNKYENSLNNDVWKLKSGDGTLNFKDYVVDSVKQFVQVMMKMKLIANDLNILLTPTELSNIKLAANDYSKKLTDGDRAFIKCSSDDIYNAFYDYHISRLVVDELSRVSKNELSISEAKVIKVQYIEFEDKKKADEVFDLLKAKGASFSYYAKTRSDDTNIDMIIKRGDEISTKFPELFYLSKGEVSEVLQNVNKFYIFKCIDDYMVEETENRRLEILRAMKNDEFNKNYLKYAENYQSTSNSEYWNKIDLEKGAACKIHSFEEIYYGYFPKTIK